MAGQGPPAMRRGACSEVETPMRATRMPRDPGRQGFTLMEAMVVVAIIGISAAIAAPALTQAMANRRANEAQHELVRIGARARSESMAYGRAHLLTFAPGANGTVALWRGRSNLCNGNAWGTIMAAASTCADNPSCVDAIAMSRYDVGSHSVVMEMTGGPWLCFQPDGQVFAAAAGARFAPAGVGTEAATFTFTHYSGGTDDNSVRQVVFPFGAAPRIAR